jgi:hypothetical protein
MTRPLDPDDSGPAKNLNVRMPQRYIDALRKEVDRQQKEHPDVSMSVSLVLRGLIRRALLEPDDKTALPKGECVACGQVLPTRSSLQRRLKRAYEARDKDPNGKRGFTREEIVARLGGKDLGVADALNGKGTMTTKTGRQIANLLSKKGY